MGKIAYLIQHHPSRAGLLDRLLASVPDALVVADEVTDVPDPWRGYKRCLEAIPADCTHACILQDDALPAEGFAEALPLIAARNPERPVCLWMGGIPAATAGRAKRLKPDVRYIPLGPANFVPLVAVLWPRTKTDELVHWTTTTAYKLTRADDGNVARWARQTKQEFLVAVPSIVEHDDFTPTVKGGRAESQGRDRSRVALFLAEDARDYQW